MRFTGVILEAAGKRPGLFALLKMLGDRSLPLEERALLNLAIMAATALKEHRIRANRAFWRRAENCVKMAVYQPERVMTMRDFTRFAVDTAFFEAIAANHPVEAGEKLDRAWRLFEALFELSRRALMHATLAVTAGAWAVSCVLRCRPYTRRKEATDAGVLVDALTGSMSLS